MRANIYIRKENEKTWESLKDKSEWVNVALSKLTITNEVTPVPYSDKPPMQIPSVFKTPTAKTCKHGMDPELCKFAKPGQKCKG